MNNDFSALKTALISVGVPVYHNEAFEQSDEYIVWNQTDQLYEYSGNRFVYTGWRVAIDFFTKEEYDSHVDEILMALTGIGANVSDNTRIYEPDTGYTHFAITAEVWDG